MALCGRIAVEGFAPHELTSMAGTSPWRGNFPRLEKSRGVRLVDWLKPLLGPGANDSHGLDRPFSRATVELYLTWCSWTHP